MENVIAELKKMHFALQIDESNAISNNAQLILFIRFIDDDAIINQFLCCYGLPTTEKGQDVESSD